PLAAADGVVAGAAVDDEVGGLGLLLGAVDGVVAGESFDVDLFAGDGVGGGREAGADPGRGDGGGVARQADGVVAAGPVELDAVGGVEALRDERVGAVRVQHRPRHRQPGRGLAGGVTADRDVVGRRGAVHDHLVGRAVVAALVDRHLLDVGAA